MIIVKVYGNKANEQKIINVLKNSDIEPRDYVELIKVKGATEK